MVAKFCLFMDVLRKLAGVLRWCKLILIYAVGVILQGVLFSVGRAVEDTALIPERQTSPLAQRHCLASPPYPITNAHRRRNPGSPS